MSIKPLALAMLSAIALSACMSNPSMATHADTAMTMPANPVVGGAPMYASKDIIDNAVNSRDHTTLVAAVKAAGLVDTLNGPGPFTIFAPSNDAFAKIDPATLKTLLADPKGALTKILTYHVVAGQKMTAADLVKAGTVKTVNGASSTIAQKGDTITVNGQSAVVCGNVQTANATVQIIDTVLMPPS